MTHAHRVATDADLALEEEIRRLNRVLLDEKSRAWRLSNRVSALYEENERLRTMIERHGLMML